MTTIHTISRQAGLTSLCAIALLAGSMTGCRGDRTDKPPRQFLPDLDDQPKVKPQTASEFYEDGSSQRPLVDRTVPWGATSNDPSAAADAEWGGFMVADRERMLKADQTYSFGLVAGSSTAEPVYADFMPVEVTEAIILRGRERFDIYCSACHGYTGVGGQAEGAGTVGKLWSYAPANLLADLYRDRSTYQGKDGYLFHVIRDGLWKPDGGNRMPAYKHAVSEADAWAIVAYIRTLQAAQGVSFDTLEAADKARLDANGGNP